MPHVRAPADKQHPEGSGKTSRTRKEKRDIVTPVDAPDEPGQISDGSSADLVRGNHPTEHQAHVSGSEDPGSQSNGRRHRGNPIKAIEDRENRKPKKL